MKIITTITLTLLCYGLSSGQSFDYNPTTQKARFQGTGGDAAVELSIGVYQGIYEHARLRITDEESHPFFDLTYDDGGKLILSKLDGKQASEFSNNTISFIDQNNLKYQLGWENGFQAFDNNGNLLYKMTDSEGLQGFDAKEEVISQFSNNEITLYNDSDNPKVRISRSTGLEVFNNNNGNLMYRMNGQVLSGYKNDGTETIRINTNLGGDGRISTDELEIMGGSDFSENFDVEAHASSTIEPGMLVSIVGESGKLALSSIKRDKKVVGIISGANGIETGMIMGQKGSIADGDYPIALSGRTYVFANTENGSIEPGDFITTSSKPGYGMKVKKHKKAQGAIVGKAMTSLKEGSGYVLVLVNLQ